MNAQQLRNSILQEAIEGRLVPQDPNDEPASALLERIREEKQQLVKEGRLKKKDLVETPISEDEKPFDIPDSWEWCRLVSISLDSADGPFGSNLKQEHYTTLKEVRIIQLSNIGEFGWKDANTKYTTYKHLENIKRSEAFAGDIIIAKMMPAGRAIICPSIDNKYVLSSDAVRFNFSDELYRKYLFYAINSNVFRSQVYGNVQGITRVRTSLTKLREYFIPLPPLAEQKRIVEKIEELMPKVEEYGKAQDALNKLNNDLPERLKKSILQEAIEGRLVPQDPNDEPASALLERIREEKKRLVKEGKLKKKDLIETPISDDEKPFDIPDSWEWVRLGEVVYNHGQKKPTSLFSYIDIGSIDNKHQKLNKQENVLEAKKAPSRARKIVQVGDVIYATVRPYLHNMCIIDKFFSHEPIASTGFAVLACYNGLYNKFLFYYLLSPIFDEYANDGNNSRGVAYPAINDDKLYKGIVPLPPLAEQKRIVSKIEELMKEIDKL